MSNAALHNQVLDVVIDPTFVSGDWSEIMPRVKARVPSADWPTIGRAIVDAVEITRETLSGAPFDPQVRAGISALDAQRVSLAALWYAFAPELPSGFTRTLCQRFRLNDSELREALILGQSILDLVSQ